MTPDTSTLNGRYSVAAVTPAPGRMAEGPSHQLQTLHLAMQLQKAVTENVLHIPHAFMISTRPTLTVGDQTEQVYDLVMDYTSCPEGLHEIHTFLGGSLREQIVRQHGYQVPTHRISLVVEGESCGVRWMAQTSYDLVPAEYRP